MLKQRHLTTILFFIFLELEGIETPYDFWFVIRELNTTNISVFSSRSINGS